MFAHCIFSQALLEQVLPKPISIPGIDVTKRLLRPKMLHKLLLSRAVLRFSAWLDVVTPRNEAVDKVIEPRAFSSGNKTDASEFVGELLIKSG